jgi:opacity protein-like surface antigen
MVWLRSFVVAGVFAAFGLLLIAQSAVAADMDDSSLRGPLSPQSSTASYANWDGVYFGAQVGVANMNTDFGNAASQLFGNNLSNTTLEEQYNVSSWALMPTNTINGQSYGAFLGYNVQWEELVFGFDMAYNHMSSMASSSSAGSINRTVTTSDGTYLVNISGQASDELIDYATLRGRAGYAFGQFLPYVVVGAAVGRFDYTTTANLQVCGPDFPDTECSTSTTTTSTTGTNTTGTTGTNTTGTTGTNTTGTNTTGTTGTNTTSTTGTTGTTGTNTTGTGTTSTGTTSTNGTPVTSTISTTGTNTTGISTNGTSTPGLTGTSNTGTSTPGTSTTGTLGTSTTVITGTSTTGTNTTGTAGTNTTGTTGTNTTGTTGTNTTGTTGTNTTSTTGTNTTGTTGTTSIKSSRASLSNSKNNAIVAGFVGGLGMDVALLPNVFLRGEWEFVAFAPVSGIRANLNTVRVGIAVKF